MRINKKEPIILVLGDIFFLYLSLFITLLVITSGFPYKKDVLDHLAPFSILFAAWIIVFFIAGLYDKHTSIFREKLPSIILNAQTTNSFLAVLFFYLIPYFVITPKTNLFIYLIISFILLVFWRVYLFGVIRSPEKKQALLIASGEEMEELFREVNSDPRYELEFSDRVNLEKEKGAFLISTLKEKFAKNNFSAIVVDFGNPKVQLVLPELYMLFKNKIEIIDGHQIYEEIFDRVPVSIIDYRWFISNISLSPKFSYDLLKRLMDILISLPLALISLILYPFIFLSLKLEDGREIFSYQDRIGQNNKVIRLIKFRTMEFNDGGKWETEGKKNKITKTGEFLRKTRIDELPQLWNVLKGDISLIGPRPEFPDPVDYYNENVPHYNIRHLIKPGLSGWAQIYHDNHPHHGTDVNETKVKLSYDLFYIKNRSFFLDLKIALKTIRILLSRSGA